MGIAWQCVALRHHTRKFAKDVWQIRVDCVLGTNVSKPRASDDDGVEAVGLSRKSFLKCERDAQTCEGTGQPRRMFVCWRFGSFSGRQRRKGLSLRHDIRDQSQPEHSRERRQEGPHTEGSALSHSHPQNKANRKGAGDKDKGGKGKGDTQRLVQEEALCSFTKVRRADGSQLHSRKTSGQLSCFPHRRPGNCNKKTSAPQHRCALTTWAVTALKLSQIVVDSDAKSLEILRSVRFARDAPKIVWKQSWIISPYHATTCPTTNLSTIHPIERERDMT